MPGSPSHSSCAEPGVSQWLAASVYLEAQPRERLDASQKHKGPRPRHSQASQRCWNGGLSPPRSCLGCPIPLCTAIWLLERCLRVVTEPQGGVVSFAAPGAQDGVLTGWWGCFGVQGADPHYRRALVPSPSPAGCGLSGCGWAEVLGAAGGAASCRAGLCTLFALSVKRRGCG